MKAFVFISVLLCILVLGSVSWTSTAATNGRTQRAVTTFDNPVKVQGVVLQGKYLFVHDEAAMARGDACTYIFKGEAALADKLVASFHCIHVERTKAPNFVLRFRETTPGVVELTEFQFKGDTASHRVPIGEITAVVPVAN